MIGQTNRYPYHPTESSLLVLIRFLKNNFKIDSFELLSIMTDGLTSINRLKMTKNLFVPKEQGGAGRFLEVL